MDDLIIRPGGVLRQREWALYEVGVCGPDAGLLVTWLGCDREEAIVALVNRWSASAEEERTFFETLKFDTGRSGKLMLFDATECGREVASAGVTLTLPPGQYEMLATLFKADDCEVVIREIRAALVNTP